MLDGEPLPGLLDDAPEFPPTVPSPAVAVVAAGLPPGPALAMFPVPSSFCGFMLRW